MFSNTDSLPIPFSSFISPFQGFSNGYFPLKSKYSLAPRIIPSHPSGRYRFWTISGMYSLRIWNVYSASTSKQTTHVKCHQAWCLDISCDMGPEIPLMYCMLSAMKWSFIIFNKSFGIWNLFNYEPVQHWSMNPGSSRIF